MAPYRKLRQAQNRQTYLVEAVYRMRRTYPDFVWARVQPRAMLHLQRLHAATDIRIPETDL